TTWACAARPLTPRMQYTASSYAAPLLDSFHPLEGVRVDASAAAFHSHPIDLVLRPGVPRVAADRGAGARGTPAPSGPTALVSPVRDPHRARAAGLPRPSSGGAMSTPWVTLVAVLLVAPALPGIATRTKSVLSGRRGAPVLQLYADLAKLARKGVVYSRTVTLVFRLAPVVVTSAVVLAAVLLPLDGRAPIF